MQAASTVRDAAQQAVQANRDHQYAIKIYTERLESELQTVDRLLNLADLAGQGDEPDLDVGGYIVIPGAKKAVAPIPSVELLSQDSPFYYDAQRRSQFLNFTTLHPMKVKELEALAEAVRNENLRKEAMNARGHGSLDLQPSSTDMALNKDGLNWARIAEKVSEVSSIPRSPQECEIRWLGDRHPQINHSSWSTEEISNLRSIVSGLPTGQIDWVEVSNQLGTNRSPIDCMRNGIQRMNHLWTPESDNRLIECVKTYGLDNWNLVARHVSEDATATGCQSRYHRTIDPSVKRGNWTPGEDEKLRRAVTVYRSSWVEIASMIPGRTNDQCRDRWSDCLNPTVVKGRWSSEEDELLLQAVEALGGKWKEVSERLGNGRTDNMCRSRYDVLTKRKKSSGAARLRRTSSATPSAGKVHSAGRRPKEAINQKGKGKEVVTAEHVRSDIPPGDTPTILRQRPKPKPKPRGVDVATTSDDPDREEQNQLEVPLQEAGSGNHEDTPPAGFDTQAQSSMHDGNTDTHYLTTSSTEATPHSGTPQMARLANKWASTTKRKKVGGQLQEESTKSSSVPTLDAVPNDVMSSLTTDVTEETNLKTSAKPSHPLQPVRSSARLKQKRNCSETETANQPSHLSPRQRQKVRDTDGIMMDMQ